MKTLNGLSDEELKEVWRKLCAGSKRYSHVQITDLMWKANREGKPRPVYFRCAQCNGFHLK